MMRNTPNRVAKANGAEDGTAVSFQDPVVLLVQPPRVNKMYGGTNEKQHNIIYYHNKTSYATTEPKKIIRTYIIIIEQKDLKNSRSTLVVCDRAFPKPTVTK